LAAAGPDGLLERVQHERGAHAGGGVPPQGHARAISMTYPRTSARWSASCRVSTGLRGMRPSTGSHRCAMGSAAIA
jgi:hypothetical protein